MTRVYSKRLIKIYKRFMFALISMMILLTLVVRPDSVFAAQLAAPKYVAIGDSITTGGSIPRCNPDRILSPWGCTTYPQATPYPDIVASRLGYSQTDNLNMYRSTAGNFPNVQLDRVGIWGDTVQAAAKALRKGKNEEGPWMPQLQAVESTRGLVTGSLGINDLHFSNLSYWLRLYLSSINRDRVTPAVKQLISARSADFDSMFSALNVARMHGSQIIVTLYYNPFDSAKVGCLPLKSIGDRLVNALDDELAARAAQYNFTVADFRTVFAGHGAGSDDSYVFGSHCAVNRAITDLLPDWLLGNGTTALVSRFDPHPNAEGTAVMANLIYGKLQWPSD